MVAFGEVEGLMYDVLQNIKTSELRKAHHFLLPNSYIILQYFSLAYVDHFILPNSYFTRQNSIIPEGD